MLASTTTPPRRSHGLPCSVRVLLDTLEPEDVARLESWLPIDSGASSAGIADALHADGHPASPSQIGKHRRGDCRCTA